MTQRRAVTRKMVAEAAGVTETIVSYVINDNRYVDGKKRQRVLDAVKRLGYRPNVAARMLKFKKSNHLLFIADNIENEHFGVLLSEIDRLLYDKGYFISLAKNRDGDEFVEHIISRQFDGVFVSSISVTEECIAALAAAGIPVVVYMNREFRRLPETVGRVYPGLYEGARQCVRHLYAGGSRKIIYIDRISKWNHFSDKTDLRLKGFLDEMNALGCAPDNANVITGCRSEEEVIGKIVSLINDGVAVDGIAARNDGLAAIAMKAVKRLGLTIPEQVAVIGFDNSNLSRSMTPALTTMEIDRVALAESSVAILKGLMSGTHPEPITLRTNLIVRESTR